MATSTIKADLQQADFTLNLTDLTWTGNGTNKYYATSNDFAPSGKAVYALSIISWNALRPSDIVQPYISGNGKLGVIANTNSFLSGANVTVRISFKYL